MGSERPEASDGEGGIPPSSEPGPERPDARRAPRAEWTDSHCHVQSMDDAEGVIERARAAGIRRMVCVGTDLATSTAAYELASANPDLDATVGLHPHDASRLADDREGLDALARAPGVVGIGEAGFDLHYRHSPGAAQEEAFRWQIGLAKELDLALVIHTREAWAETFRVLDDEGAPSRTVFHCFTGGPDDARRALDLGAFLSFSGILTFPNAEHVRAAAARTPVDRVLVETDAPYLAPVPMRGRVNEPALVGYVGRALADVIGAPEADLAERVRANTDVVFRG